MAQIKKKVAANSGKKPKTKISTDRAKLAKLKKQKPNMVSRQGEVAPSTSAKVNSTKFKHAVNNMMVRRAVNVVLQQAISLGLSSGLSDTNANDYANAYTELIREIYRAMSGQILKLDKHPTFFREILDSCFPETSSDKKHSKSFDPLTIEDLVIAEVDGVHWGELNGEYGTTGCLTVATPFSPSTNEGERLSSCARIFEAFQQAGHKMIGRTQKTNFENDLSVFANFTPDNTKQDFTYGDGDAVTGTVGNEGGVGHLWLASLRFAASSQNRVSTGLIYPIYAPGGSYLTARILSKKTGVAGRFDQVRIKILPGQDYLSTMEANCVEVMRKELQSSAPQSSTGGVFTSGDVKGFQAYVMMVIQTFFQSESSAGLGLKTSTGQAPAWGTQFRERGVVAGATLSAFWMQMETLRRTQMYSKKIDGIPTYFFAIPTFDCRDYYLGPGSWGNSVFPTLDMATFTDGAIAVTNCDTVVARTMIT